MYSKIQIWSSLNTISYYDKKWDKVEFQNLPKCSRCKTSLYFCRKLQIVYIDYSKYLICENCFFKNDLYISTKGGLTYNYYNSEEELNTRLKHLTEQKEVSTLYTNNELDKTSQNNSVSFQNNVNYTGEKKQWSKTKTIIIVIIGIWLLIGLIVAIIYWITGFDLSKFI